MNPRPLGYEPYDVGLRYLGQSLVTALTSADLRLEVFPCLLRLPRLRVSLYISCTDPCTNPVPGAEWEWAKGERPDMIAVQEGGGTRAS